MKKFLAICATAVLFTTLGLAQGNTNPQSSNDNAQYNGDVQRHDYGWIGLLGLLGLGGLIRRRDAATRDTNTTEARSIDDRRVA
jgi:MYXO-CTERM domain-containing protein